MHASNACILWTLAFWYKYFLSSVHMLLTHVFHEHLFFCTSMSRRPYTCFYCRYFIDICFLVQVFIVVSTHASNACISRTLAFWYKYVLSSMHVLLIHVFHGHLLFLYKCFLSSVHMLLMHVFRVYLLFYTSIFSRPSLCIYLYGKALVGELTLGKKRRTSGILSFHHFKWE